MCGSYDKLDLPRSLPEERLEIEPNHMIAQKFSFVEMVTLKFENVAFMPFEFRKNMDQKSTKR